MPQIPWLDQDKLEFPPLEQALRSPDGLLAAGGDLSAQRLLLAYSKGIFPWYEQDQPILWWSPNPRTVIFPENLHISRSLRKTLRQRKFNLTADKAFEQVIRACATTRISDTPENTPENTTTGTWITQDMYHAYCHLHQLGYAHSIEVWLDGKLVGGLYGIAIGRAFFGESMFSLERDASKVAFVYLVGQLSAWHFKMIDCQVQSGHLLSLGAEEIPRQQFCQILIDCIDTTNIDTTNIDITNTGSTEENSESNWQMTWQYSND